MTDADLIMALKERLELAGSPKALAERLGYSATVIHDSIKGRRRVSAGLARAMGYEQAYTPIASPPEPRQSGGSANQWLLKGVALVLKFGSTTEITAARNRLAGVRAIQRQTDRWLAQQQREAA